MLFNSLAFLIFFAVVIALHYLPLPWRVKKVNLLIGSYIFYAAWNPPFVILLWISTVVDRFAAGAMSREERPARRKVLLGLSLLANLGMLSYFKYGNLLAELFTNLMNPLGFEYTAPELSIILPVGISFYTFQTLSYTIDVYLKRSETETSFLDFALFVTFFPQLVAGPIVRPYQLIPQFKDPRTATEKQFVWGLFLFTWGLFQKSAIADGVLSIVVGIRSMRCTTSQHLTPGLVSWHSPVKSSSTSPATRSVPLALPCAWGSPFPTTSNHPMRLLAFPTSGSGGTSLSPDGCGTIQEKLSSSFWIILQSPFRLLHTHMSDPTSQHTLFSRATIATVDR